MKREYDEFVSRIRRIERRMQINSKQKEHLEKPVAVQLLLDLVKEVPSSRLEGDYPFDGQLDHIPWVLEYLCGGEHWIGPLFKKARSEPHPGYGWIAVNVVKSDVMRLSGIYDGNGGSPIISGVALVVMDRIVPILDCAESSQPWVKKAALEALDILKPSFFLKSDGATIDLTAWRKQLTELAGWTPLHWAAFSGHRDEVELLLAGKAEVNAKSKCGETPFRVAAFMGHKELAEFLHQHGGHD
jgi:hypothetical protein